MKNKLTRKIFEERMLKAPPIARAIMAHEMAGEKMTLEVVRMVDSLSDSDKKRFFEIIKEAAKDTKRANAFRKKLGLEPL